MGTARKIQAGAAAYGALVRATPGAAGVDLEAGLVEVAALAGLHAAQDVQQLVQGVLAIVVIVVAVTLPQEARDFIRREHPHVVAFVQAETSTGMFNQGKPICEAAHEVEIFHDRDRTEAADRLIGAAPNEDPGIVVMMMVSCSLRSPCSAASSPGRARLSVDGTRTACGNSRGAMRSRCPPALTASRSPGCSMFTPGRARTTAPSSRARSSSSRPSSGTVRGGAARSGTVPTSRIVGASPRDRLRRATFIPHLGRLLTKVMFVEQVAQRRAGGRGRPRPVRRRVRQDAALLVRLRHPARRPGDGSSNRW